MKHVKYKKRTVAHCNHLQQDSSGTTSKPCEHAKKSSCDDGLGRATDLVQIDLTTEYWRF